MAVYNKEPHKMFCVFDNPRGHNFKKQFNTQSYRLMEAFIYFLILNSNIELNDVLFRNG